MENIITTISTDKFLIAILILFVLLLIGFIVMIFKFSSLNKRYQNFMKKLGEGKDIQESLETYMYRVEKVERQNAEILDFCQNIEEDVSSCIQKIGIVRYSAFKDTGSDLSFALALLDETNSGVVLNGIYSREMSNIYAKPVENGKSNYTISEEEQQAIEKAIQSKNIYHIKDKPKDN